jgi:hypothetical protein
MLVGEEEAVQCRLKWHCVVFHYFLPPFLFFFFRLKKNEFGE